MPYIGNTSPSRFVSNRAASVFSGDGSTTAFTLEQAVVQDEDILVSVDGVIQEPSVAYAVSNATTLTFTEAPSSNSGNNIFVYYLVSQVGTVGPPNDSVSTDTLKNSAVSTAKIASSAVDLTSKVTGVLPVANGGTGVSSNFSYTEGTYTPQLFDAVTGGNGGGAEASNGNYVKIGKLCHVSIRMVNVTKSGLTGGNVAHFSLPFTAANIVSNYSTNFPLVSILGGTSGSEAPPVLRVDPNTSRFFFSRIVDNDASVEFTVDNIGSSFDLTTSVTYITAT